MYDRRNILFPNLSLWFCASQFYAKIFQQDAAVRSQFYIIAALLYLFRVLSTPIIRSTLTFTHRASSIWTGISLLSRERFLYI